MKRDLPAGGVVRELVNGWGKGLRGGERKAPINLILFEPWKPGQPERGIVWPVP